MRSTSIYLLVGIAAIAILLAGRGDVDAYSQWSIADDATNCGECHGDFRSDNYISPVDGENWGNLHDLHREVMLNDDCAACHLASDEFPVKLNESAGGNGFEPVSCMGCHGVDPNPGTFNTQWGAGLRLHHINAGVRADQDGFTCTSTCHQNDPQPPGEDTLPSYYFLPDAAHPNKPTDPCNPAPGLPEDFAGLALGMDNDGDLQYDQVDFDCSGLFEDRFESGDTSAWTRAVP